GMPHGTRGQSRPACLWPLRYACSPDMGLRHVAYTIVTRAWPSIRRLLSVGQFAYDVAIFLRPDWALPPQSLIGTLLDVPDMLPTSDGGWRREFPRRRRGSCCSSG